MDTVCTQRFLIASQSPATCPLGGVLDPEDAVYYHFEKAPPAPVKGRFALPEAAGFGVELDDARIDRERSCIGRRTTRQHGGPSHLASGIVTGCPDPPPKTT